MGFGRACRKPIVTACHGISYTLGIELALAGDIVIAADNCRFVANVDPTTGELPNNGDFEAAGVDPGMQPRHARSMLRRRRLEDGGKVHGLAAAPHDHGKGNRPGVYQARRHGAVR